MVNVCLSLHAATSAASTWNNRSFFQFTATLSSREIATTTYLRTLKESNLCFARRGGPQRKETGESSSMSPPTR
jgi:hypothetical protein